MKKKEIIQKLYEDERSLFGQKNLRIRDTIFDKGESPLKESSDIELSDCMFRYKYPLWYVNNVYAKNTTWFEMARAGVWYAKNVTVEESVVTAPKNFRRCEDLTLTRVDFTNAEETLWSCRNVRLQDVHARGPYFAMNSEDMEVDGLILDGNYSFDGVKNSVIRNSTLITKDAFWNTENVTVENCFISGEYLGWNARNLTLIGCTIESLQGMCYIDHLIMKDCKLINTTLAFEYSSVDAEITSKVDSILNPGSGTIRAERIDRLIIERDYCDEGKTKIICDDIGVKKDVNDEL